MKTKISLPAAALRTFGRSAGFAGSAGFYGLTALAVNGLAALAVTGLMALSEASAKPGWTEDYQEAQKRSKAEGKPLLLDFTGSDWCGFCILLDREVFSKAAFKEFAESNFVLMEVDYPRNKAQAPSLVKQNEMLDRLFQIQSYPTLVVLSPEGKVLKRWEEVPADLLKELKALVPSKSSGKESRK